MHVARLPGEKWADYEVRRRAIQQATPGPHNPVKPVRKRRARKPAPSYADERSDNLGESFD